MQTIDMFGMFDIQQAGWPKVVSPMQFVGITTSSVAPDLTM